MNTSLIIRNWHWEITKRCNLKCHHCIIGDRSDYEITTEEAFDAVARIVELGGKRLFITGGEPLMRDDLCEIIQKAHDLGLAVSLITNGTKAKRTFLKNIGKYICNIAISIDGDSQVQDKIRGKGVYSRCVSAIKLISDFGIDISVYATINKLNENFISTFVEEMIILGIRSFHFNEINPEGRAQDNKDLLLSSMKTADRICLVQSQLKKTIVIDDLVVSAGCLISPDTVYMQSDGTLFACVELALKSPGQSMANILTKDIYEIRESVNYFFAQTKYLKKDKCCYTSFSSPGVNICLNEPWACPIIRRVDGE